MTARDELLQSVWKKEDGLIREYLFHNEKSLDFENTVWEFQHSIRNMILSAPLPFVIIACPCVCCQAAYLGVDHQIFYENKIEYLWARRLGLTENGITYKELRKKPLTLNPMNPCAQCMCDVGRYVDFEIGEKTKTIPYDRVEDVLVREPAGGVRQAVYLCGIELCPYEVGDMIMRVDTTVEIDTAGGARNGEEDMSELFFLGLINPTDLRNSVLAMKHGQDLPPPGVGVRQGGNQVHAPYEAPLRRPSRSVSSARATAASTSFTSILPGPPGITVNPMHSAGAQVVAPGVMEMSTSAAQSNAQISLLTAIDDKLRQIITLQMESKAAKEES